MSASSTTIIGNLSRIVAIPIALAGCSATAIASSRASVDASLTPTRTRARPRARPRHLALADEGHKRGMKGERQDDRLETNVR
jgi:hypothetical protein